MTLNHECGRSRESDFQLTPTLSLDPPTSCLSGRVDGVALSEVAKEAGIIKARCFVESTSWRRHRRLSIRTQSVSTSSLPHPTPPPPPPPPHLGPACGIMPRTGLVGVGGQRQGEDVRPKRRCFLVSIWVRKANFPLPLSHYSSIARAPAYFYVFLLFVRAHFRYDLAQESFLFYSTWTEHANKSCCATKKSHGQRNGPNAEKYTLQPDTREKLLARFLRFPPRQTIGRGKSKNDD